MSLLKMSFITFITVFIERTFVSINVVVTEKKKRFFLQLLMSLEMRRNAEISIREKQRERERKRKTKRGIET